MNRPNYPTIVLVTAAAALAALSACAPLPPAEAGPPATAEPAVHADPVLSADHLITRLRADGLTVEAVGGLDQPFFSVPGRLIRVAGADVQVFEYASAAEASADAGQIAPDGGSIGTHQVSWLAAPHFYTAGRLIVLYVGDDPAVLAELETVLDPPIAGR